MSGKLSGVMALPPTPLSKDGRVDADGLRSLIDFELVNGCDGIGVLAAWARGYLMSDKDGETVAKISIDHVNGRSTILLGIASMGTGKAEQRFKLNISLT